MSEPTTGHVNCLVVDDDLAIVRFADRLLHSMGDAELSVVALTDPLLATPYLEYQDCDLLISDVVMPEIDGIELLRLAKEKCVWTQAIMMTASPSLKTLGDAVKFGAADFLVKPIKPDDFLARVGEAITRVRRLRQVMADTVSWSRQKSTWADASAEGNSSKPEV